MARKRWGPGSVVRNKLDDRFTYYGRLLEFPWVAFYDFRTLAPLDNVGEIVDHPILFTVAAHKSLISDREWEIVGHVPLESSLRRPRAQFIQDPIDPSRVRIIDDQDNIRTATPEQAQGLERAAVWEPEHIADRLMDYYAGRPNVWLEQLKFQPPRKGVDD